MAAWASKELDQKPRRNALRFCGLLQVREEFWLTSCMAW